MTVKLDPTRDVSTLLEDDNLVGRALERAAHQAIREHRRDGLPLAMWRDGKVVWVPAEELEGEIEEADES
jgi:hypothetical protein